MNEFVLKAVEKGIKSYKIIKIEEIYLSKSHQMWVGSVLFEYKNELFASNVPHMRDKMTAQTLINEILLEVEKEKERIDMYIYQDTKRKYNHKRDISNHELHTVIKRQIIQLSNIYKINIDSEEYDKNYSKRQIEKEIRTRKSPIEIFKKIRDDYYADQYELELNNS